MKKLVNIILLGCALLFAVNSYSQIDICIESKLDECWFPENYNPPVKIISTPDPVCKIWSSGDFNCGGGYYIAVYPPVGQTPTKFTFDTTCPGNVGIEVQPGEQIENILRTFSDAQLNGLSANEIREGKIPLMLYVTFPQAQTTGQMTTNVYCDEWDKDDEPSKDYIAYSGWMGFLALLLTGSDTY